MEDWSGRTEDRRRLAVRWIMELATTVFVDEMRLLTVALSRLGRRHNESRYSEFARRAENHIADFGTQLGRYVPDLEGDFLSATRTLEKSQRAIFRELEKGPCAPDRGRRLLQPMSRAATEIHTLCQAHGLSGYPETCVLVARTAGALWQQCGKPCGLEAMDAIFMLRLNIQTALLDTLQRGEPSPILTIIDDVQQSFSATYFLLDRWLLGHVFPDAVQG
jgi:hypothetical protein